MKKFYCILACFVILPAILFAQEGPPSAPPPDDRALDRIANLRKVRLIEILDLKEEQSVRFLARLNEHEKNRRELMKERGDALDRVDRLIRNKADDKDFEKAFADVSAVDDKMVADRREFFAGLSDILSQEQRAKMLIFERRFEKELREAMREAQKQRKE